MSTRVIPNEAQLAAWRRMWAWLLTLPAESKTDGANRSERTP